MDVFLCSEYQRFRYAFVPRQNPSSIPLTFNIACLRSYSYNTFILCQKALQSSIKVSLRIDDEGFLSLQLMMPKPAHKELEGKDFGIIEFKMKPLQDDDEE